MLTFLSNYSIKHPLVQLKQLTKEDLNAILPLASLLNPSIKPHLLKNRQLEMFQHAHYKCFGLYLSQELIAISSTWSTTRFYSGKQLELDNVVVAPAHRSKGIGNCFMEMIENWAKENNYETIELNSYIENIASHRFYERLSYVKLGHHFQKKI